MKRASILGLALAVAAGSVWVLLSSRSAREEPIAIAPRPSSHAPVPRADALPAPRVSRDADDGAPTDPLRVRAERRSAATAVAPARFEESLAPEDGLLVRVVTEDGAPVPEATIFWFAGNSMTDTDEARFEASGFDVNELFETYGRRFRADARGHVVVPHPTSDVTLLGRGDELWGLGSPRPDDDEFELELAPDPALVVRVVDAGGAPVAGVVVGLRLRGGDESGSFDILRARTDAAGRAAIEHSVPLIDLIGDADSVRVGVIAPLLFAVEKQVDVAALAAPIELVLPAFGSVRLRLVDAEGAPVSESQGLRLAWGDEHSAAQGSGPRDRSATFSVDGGVVELAPVALGLELRYEVSSLQQEELAAGAFDGPMRAGERVELEIEVARASYLTGRLRMPDGEPCAARIVSLELGRPDRWDALSRRLRTRADGAFRFELTDPAAADGGLFVAVLHSEHSAAPEFSQRVTLPARVALGVNDLGDLTLEPAPILVAGTVVDENGARVAGAEVWVDASGLESTTEGWSMRVASAPQATGDDGGFAIHGYGRRARLRVRAECPGYVEFVREPPDALGVRFEPGDSTVRVPMRAAGAIEVRVLVDRGLTPLVRIAGFGGPERSDPTGNFQVEYAEPGLGRLALEGLEPGPYTVTVETAWGPSLRVFESVSVRGGETVHAGDVDLRGSLRSLRIQVTDAVGNALPASATARDGRSTWSSAKDGSIEIVTLQDPLDVKIDSFGFRSAEIDDVRGGESVVLDAGLAVHLELAGGKPGALREHEFLSVQLEPLDGAGGVPGERGPRGRFDEDGRCQLVSGRGGAHRVLLLLWVIEEGGVWKLAPLDDAARTVRILEPGPTRAVLTVTAAAIDAARRRAHVPGQGR